MNILKKIYNKAFPQWKTSTHDKITYCNWWEYNSPDDEWFTQFIRLNFPKYEKYNISFCSVFGKKCNMEKLKGKKIFYTGETLSNYVNYDELNINEHGSVYNLHNSWVENYGADRQDICDLSLGFSDFASDDYIRFPIWIWRCFVPVIDFNLIKSKIDEINTNFRRHVPQRECVLVAGHDDFGTREHIYNGLKDIVHITSVGKWHHNSDELWLKYPTRDKLGKDKIKYMQDFKFNICPENMDVPNYVTEKIFDAFQSGTIPIYHGALNNPEPEIINKNAVIFWDFTYDNKNAINLIQDLNSNDKYLDEFLHIRRLNENAADIVYDKLMNLKKHIERLLE